MAVSRATALEVSRVMQKYVAREKLPRLLDELAAIPGNKSYKESIRYLRNILLLDSPRGTW